MAGGLSASEGSIENPLAARCGQAPELLIMRHPQTVRNLEHRYLGQGNAALTKLGEEQLRRAVAGLADWRPDRIVSSPLERCLAIAEPAARELGLEAVVDPDVIELDFGELEGLTFEEASARGLPFPWGETVGSWPCPGGEPLERFHARCARAARRYVRLPGRTAIVSHGGATRALCSALMGLPDSDTWRMDVGNVCSALFTVRGPMVFLTAFGLEPEELKGR